MVFPFSHPFKNLGVCLALLVGASFFYQVPTMGFQASPIILACGGIIIFLSLLLSIVSILLLLLRALKKGSLATIKTSLKHRKKILNVSMAPVRLSAKTVKTTGSAINQSARQNITELFEGYLIELDDIVHDLTILNEKIDQTAFVLELFEISRKTRVFTRSIETFKSKYGQVGTYRLYLKKRTILNKLTGYLDEGNLLIATMTSLLQTQIEKTNKKESET